jgi:AcrR family transcriptional regulator
MSHAAQPIRKRARNAREAILDAAQHVAARDGAAHLTLDAVAREIGMTKGGVLYNFPTKANLLQGMLERMVETFGRIVEERVAASGPEVRNPTLRATLEAYDYLERLDSNLFSAILAVAVNDPDLVEPVRALKHRLQAQVMAEAADPDLAMVVMVAIDGLHFERMMRLPPADPQQRAQIATRLRSLVDAMEGAR